MTWNKEDLTSYNRSEAPWYSVQDNGKVDIGNKPGDDHKISLQPWGMYKLMNDWLNSNHQLTNDQVAILIEKLNK